MALIIKHNQENFKTINCFYRCMNKEHPPNKYFYNFARLKYNEGRIPPGKNNRTEIDSTATEFEKD